MRIDLYTDAGSFDNLREEWEDLLSRSHCDTLFLHPAWSKAWWQVFGREGALRLFTARDQSGRLVGVAPLFLAEVAADGAEAMPRLSYERPEPNPSAALHPAILLVGGTEVSDYLDLIVEQGQEAVYDAFFQALQEEAGWEWMDMRCLPEGSPTPQTLTRLARAAGWRVEQAREDVCPAIELPSSWDEYLAMLSKKNRHELRRKMRRVEEAASVSVFEVQDCAGLDAHLASFVALHKASAPEKAGFMGDPRMREFFGRVSRMAAENGWLDLSFLALDGQPAATLFCFRYGDAVLVYNSGFEPEAWPGLSTGIALCGYRIRAAIESGRKVFDFMQGDERYKYDLGGVDHPVHRLLIRRD